MCNISTELVKREEMYKKLSANGRFKIKEGDFQNIVDSFANQSKAFQINIFDIMISKVCSYWKFMKSQLNFINELLLKDHLRILVFIVIIDLLRKNPDRNETQAIKFISQKYFIHGSQFNEE